MLIIFFKVAHEVLSLEILTLLLERPSDDSVEVAITFLKEVGQKLTEVSPRGIHAIFDRLRNVLHENSLDKRTSYMIEVMFQVTLSN
jgi:pre-mRNA-splicing factor CWC22